MCFCLLLDMGCPFAFVLFTGLGMFHVLLFLLDMGIPYAFVFYWT